MQAVVACVWVGHITYGGHDRRIPLLREVFEHFPEVPINIDIKVDNNELIRKVWYVPVWLAEFAVFSPHRLHAMHRCGVLLPVLHVAWPVCVGHNFEPCRNGWWDAVWVIGSREPKELCVRWGSRCSHHGKGKFRAVDGILPIIGRAWMGSLLPKYCVLLSSLI